METCKAKRGFFSLRDCGEAVSKKCALCSRPMCSRHLSPGSGFARCLDCDARQSEQKVVGPPPQQAAGAGLATGLAAGAVAGVAAGALTDPAWPYRYRSRYWRSRGYSPIYGGYDDDSYYSDYDVRSFDSDMARRGPSTAPDKPGKPGFGDS